MFGGAVSHCKRLQMVPVLWQLLFQVVPGSKIQDSTSLEDSQNMQERVDFSGGVARLITIFEFSVLAWIYIVKDIICSLSTVSHRLSRLRLPLSPLVSPVVSFVFLLCCCLMLFGIWVFEQTTTKLQIHHTSYMKTTLLVSSSPYLYDFGGKTKISCCLLLFPMM